MSKRAEKILEESESENLNGFDDEPIDTPMLGTVELEISEDAREALRLFFSRMGRHLKGMGEAFQQMEKFLGE